MGYTIETRHQERQAYVAIRTTVRMDGIGVAMGPLYGELFGWLGRHGITASGAPWTRYLVAASDEVELEVGAPVRHEVTGEGRIIGGVMPACDVVHTLHVGPYDALGAAYEAVGRWISEHGATVAGAMWEVYLSDPKTEPDPARHRTEVCFPVSLA